MLHRDMRRCFPLSPGPDRATGSQWNFKADAGSGLQLPYSKIGDLSA